MESLEFYQGKTVLVTGHTGFKGSWLCVMLQMAGANVVGYALKPAEEQKLFQLSGIKGRMNSIEGDIDIAELEDEDVVPDDLSGSTADCA